MLGFGLLRLGAPCWASGFWAWGLGSRVTAFLSLHLRGAAVSGIFCELWACVGQTAGALGLKTPGSAASEELQEPGEHPEATRVDDLSLALPITRNIPEFPWLKVSFR